MWADYLGLCESEIKVNGKICSSARFFNLMVSLSLTSQLHRPPRTHVLCNFNLKYATSFVATYFSTFIYFLYMFLLFVYQISSRIGILPILVIGISI